MQNYNSKFKSFENVKIFNLIEKEDAGVNSIIYQKRKGEDSPGGFRFERTRKTNSRVISKII